MLFSASSKFCGDVLAPNQIGSPVRRETRQSSALLVAAGMAWSWFVLRPCYHTSPFTRTRKVPREITNISGEKSTKNIQEAHKKQAGVGNCTQLAKKKVPGGASPHAGRVGRLALPLGSLKLPLGSLKMTGACLPSWVTLVVRFMEARSAQNQQNAAADFFDPRSRSLAVNNTPSAGKLV